LSRWSEKGSFMKCIFITGAKYIRDYRLWLKFNTGESGEANLETVVHKFPAASPLKDPAQFAAFHLDEWPTVAWDCGFDLDPEYLYEQVTGKTVLAHQTGIHG
jgi:hypothetical protein